MFSYEKQDDRRRNECLGKSLCIYIEIRWEEGVLMNLFIFHFNKAFLLLQKHLATNTFYYKSRFDFLPKTPPYKYNVFTF